MKTKNYLLFTIIAIFPLTLFSQTYISGLISKDSILSKDKSPYIIDNHLIINGSKLTIQPGVEIKFDGNYIISIINGTLYAKGEKEDSIVFTSNKQSEKPSNWNSIEFSNKSTCVFKYVQLSYSNNSLRSTWGSFKSAEISNCTFSNCTYGLLLEDLNNGTISNSTFINNNIGAWVTWGNISDCKFIDNNVGIEGGAININNDIFVDNNLALYITGDLIKVSKCQFISNNIAVKYIALSHGDGYIKNNVFKNNSTAIQFSCSDKSINTIGPINYNDFVNNKEYNVKILTDGSGSPAVLDFKNNWWGIDNQDTIENKIFDYFDNSSSSIIVDYEPFVDSLINITPNSVDSIINIISNNDIINYVETIKSQDFIIYPNPFSNELYLKTLTEQNIIGFMIFSIDGKLLLSGESDLLKSGIQTSNFENGLYILQLSFNEKILNFKILKN